MAGFSILHLALLLFALLSMSFAPLQRPKPPPRTPPRMKSLKIWLNPCSYENIKMRHYRQNNSVLRNTVTVIGKHKASPKPLRRLRTQLMITFDSLMKTYDDIKKYELKEIESYGRFIHYSWLPKNQIEWYREKIKCFSKTKKVLYLLPKFYNGLQNFSVAFERLKTFVDNPRREIFFDIYGSLRQLLCELDYTMLLLKVPIPYKLNKKIIKLISNDYNDVDYTFRYLYELGVLLSYKEFIEDWTWIIRQLVGPKGNKKRCHLRRKIRKFKPPI